MNEAERRVLKRDSVKLSSSVVRISGSDIVNEGIIQGTYEDKAYKFVSSKIVGTPKEKSKYYFFERDDFLSKENVSFEELYWSLRQSKRLDIIFYSIRYNKFLYIRIVGQVPASTTNEEVIISRGYSHLFGLLKKEDEIEHVSIDVADLSVINMIRDLVMQQFYEEKMLDNI